MRRRFEDRLWSPVSVAHRVAIDVRPAQPVVSRVEPEPERRSPRDRRPEPVEMRERMNARQVAAVLSRARLLRAAPEAEVVEEPVAHAARGFGVRRDRERRPALVAAWARATRARGLSGRRLGLCGRRAHERPANAVAHVQLVCGQIEEFAPVSLARTGLH